MGSRPCKTLRNFTHGEISSQNSLHPVYGRVCVSKTIQAILMSRRRCSLPPPTLNSTKTCAAKNEEIPRLWAVGVQNSSHQDHENLTVSPNPPAPNVRPSLPSASHLQGRLKNSNMRLHGGVLSSPARPTSDTFNEEVAVRQCRFPATLLKNKEHVVSCCRRRCRCLSAMPLSALLMMMMVMMMQYITTIPHSSQLYPSNLKVTQETMLIPDEEG